MTPAQVAQACRDLGWHIDCSQTLTDADDPQYVAHIVAGTAADAIVVGRGISPISAAQAIQTAWRAARDAMGARLVVRPCGAVSWEGADFAVRDRWVWRDEPPGDASR